MDSRAASWTTVKVSKVEATHRGIFSVSWLVVDQVGQMGAFYFLGQAAFTWLCLARPFRQNRREKLDITFAMSRMNSDRAQIGRSFGSRWSVLPG